MQAEVATALGARVADWRAIAGGDINQAARATLADGRVVFVKHHRAPPATAFEYEAEGLAWLAEPDAIRVARPLAHARTWLALEWIESAPRARDFDEQLGRGLARVHAAGAPSFGLDHDNFLAHLPQPNAPTRDAASFWVERRLLPLGQSWRPQIERLAEVLPTIVPREPPARLHGDLWSGNVHTDETGAPVLIDPAVYGGPREVDLAMLALFGALSPRTLAAYEEVAPLAPGWRDRVPLWQTYPLLIHATLFGGGYGASFERAIARYI